MMTTCPCCFREVSIDKKTGKIRKHEGLYAGETCIGSGQMAVELSDEAISAAAAQYLALEASYILRARSMREGTKAHTALINQASEVHNIAIYYIDQLFNLRGLKEPVAHSCPCCGKKAKSEKNIADLFGFRTINGKKKPQSNCKACRSAKSRAARLAKKAAKAAELAELTETTETTETTEINHVCPCCGETAHTEDDIEISFGYRLIKKSGALYPQSYCKGCRAAKQKAYRARKKAEKEQNNPLSVS
jgi:ribosomal protein L32